LSSELANPKHDSKPKDSDTPERTKDGVTYDHKGNVDVDATRSLRSQKRGKIEYVAPGVDQYWQAMNVVSIHWRLVAPKYGAPESLSHILACVINHARTNGRAFPSQSTIAAETGYCRWTVNTVLQWAETKTPFVTSSPRGRTKSKAYHIEWSKFEEAWLEIKQLIREIKDEDNF